MPVKNVIYILLAFVLIFIFSVIFHFIYFNGGANIKEWHCRGKEIKIWCTSHFPAKLPDTCYYLCIGRPYLNKGINDVLEELDFYRDTGNFKNLDE